VRKDWRHALRIGSGSSSEIVTKEFLLLMEVSDRLPSLPMNLVANVDGRIPTASGAKKAAANKSVENLLT
jgi:hypothetical protein